MPHRRLSSAPSLLVQSMVHHFWLFIVTAFSLIDFFPDVDASLPLRSFGRLLALMMPSMASKACCIVTRSMGTPFQTCLTMNRENSFGTRSLKRILSPLSTRFATSLLSLISAYGALPSSKISQQRIPKDQTSVFLVQILSFSVSGASHLIGSRWFLSSWILVSPPVSSRARPKSAILTFCSEKRQFRAARSQ